MFNTNSPAFVLSMFETGLGVGRSLGRKGIEVIGIDYKRDVGFHSKYIRSLLCPHPLNEPKSFLKFMISLSKKYDYKPVLFMTDDDFVLAISRVRKELSPFFLFNIPCEDLLESIMDKMIQYKRAGEVGISIPKTFCPQSVGELDEISSQIVYPALIKCRYSYMWRKHFGAIKGIVVDDKKELAEEIVMLFEKKLPVMVQEIIQGPDTNHFKFCCYVSRIGEPLLSFTLQKIRQQPIRFGVGAAVKSVHYPELVEIGTKFFTSIGYRGVGSAEFKLDKRDGMLKLIELNPRYWQQNILSDICGMNFPLVDYLEVTGQNPKPVLGFRKGIKWINIYSDFDAYLSYRREKLLTLSDWLCSLRGEKVFSDFALDDISPTLHEIRLWRNLFRVPRYLYKRLRRRRL